MISQQARRRWLKQLGYFQSQIPLGTQTPRIPSSTVEHYHQLVSEIETETGENLSRFIIPEKVRWNEDSFITDGVRDRLGSLIGYLASDFTEDKQDASNEILKIISLVQKSLRKLVRNKPNSEKEVQDKIEDLFNSNQLVFRREQEHIPYSSKTYIPDFTFEEIGCAVEVKLCDSLNREKEMIAEINDDVMAYSTRYKNIIFIIYDNGFIRDEDKFKSEIVSNSVVVEVIKN